MKKHLQEASRRDFFHDGGGGGEAGDGPWEVLLPFSPSWRANPILGLCGDTQWKGIESWVMPLSP